MLVLLRTLRPAGVADRHQIKMVEAGGVSASQSRRSRKRRRVRGAGRGERALGLGSPSRFSDSDSDAGAARLATSDSCPSSCSPRHGQRGSGGRGEPTAATSSEDSDSDDGSVADAAPVCGPDALPLQHQMLLRDVLAGAVEAGEELSPELKQLAESLEQRVGPDGDSAGSDDEQDTEGVGTADGMQHFFCPPCPTSGDDADSASSDEESDNGSGPGDSDAAAPSKIGAGRRAPSTGSGGKPDPKNQQKKKKKKKKKQKWNGRFGLKPHYEVRVLKKSRVSGCRVGFSYVSYTCQATSATFAVDNKCAEGPEWFCDAPILGVRVVLPPRLRVGLRAKSFEIRERCKVCHHRAALHRERPVVAGHAPVGGESTEGPRLCVETLEGSAMMDACIENFGRKSYGLNCALAAAGTGWLGSGKYGTPGEQGKQLRKWVPRTGDRDQASSDDEPARPRFIDDGKPLAVRRWIRSELEREACAERDDKKSHKLLDAGPVAAGVPYYRAPTIADPDAVVMRSLWMQSPDDVVAGISRLPSVDKSSLLKAAEILASTHPLYKLWYRDQVRGRVLEIPRLPARGLLPSTAMAAGVYPQDLLKRQSKSAEKKWQEQFNAFHRMTDGQKKICEAWATACDLPASAAIRVHAPRAGQRVDVGLIALERLPGVGGEDGLMVGSAAAAGPARPSSSRSPGALGASSRAGAGAGEAPAASANAQETELDSLPGSALPPFDRFRSAILPMNSAVLRETSQKKRRGGIFIEPQSAALPAIAHPVLYPGGDSGFTYVESPPRSQLLEGAAARLSAPTQAPKTRKFTAMSHTEALRFRYPQHYARCFSADEVEMTASFVSHWDHSLLLASQKRKETKMKKADIRARVDAAAQGRQQSPLKADDETQVAAKDASDLPLNDPDATAYWNQHKEDMLAVAHARGSPTWFNTFVLNAKVVERDLQGTRLLPAETVWGPNKARRLGRRRKITPVVRSPMLMVRAWRLLELAHERILSWGVMGQIVAIVRAFELQGRLVPHGHLGIWERWGIKTLADFAEHEQRTRKRMETTSVACSQDALSLFESFLGDDKDAARKVHRRYIRQMKHVCGPWCRGDNATSATIAKQILSGVPCARGFPHSLWPESYCNDRGVWQHRRLTAVDALLEPSCPLMFLLVNVHYSARPVTSPRVLICYLFSYILKNKSLRYFKIELHALREKQRLEDAPGLAEKKVNAREVLRRGVFFSSTWAAMRLQQYVPVRGFGMVRIAVHLRDANSVTVPTKRVFQAVKKGAVEVREVEVVDDTRLRATLAKKSRFEQWLWRAADLRGLSFSQWVAGYERTKEGAETELRKKRRGAVDFRAPRSAAAAVDEMLGRGVSADDCGGGDDGGDEDPNATSGERMMRYYFPPPGTEEWYLLLCVEAHPELFWSDAEADGWSRALALGNTAGGAAARKMQGRTSLASSRDGGAAQEPEAVDVENSRPAHSKAHLFQSDVPSGTKRRRLDLGDSTGQERRGALGSADTSVSRYELGVARRRASGADDTDKVASFQQLAVRLGLWGDNKSGWQLFEHVVAIGAGGRRDARSMAATLLTQGVIPWSKVRKKHWRSLSEDMLEIEAGREAARRRRYGVDRPGLKSTPLQRDHADTSLAARCENKRARVLWLEAEMRKLVCGDPVRVGLPPAPIGSEGSGSARHEADWQAEVSDPEERVRRFENGRLTDDQRRAYVYVRERMRLLGANFPATLRDFHADDERVSEIVELARADAAVGKDVVALLGLPGTGKTHVCRAIEALGRIGEKPVGVLVAANIKQAALQLTATGETLYSAYGMTVDEVEGCAVRGKKMRSHVRWRARRMGVHLWDEIFSVTGKDADLCRETGGSLHKPRGKLPLHIVVGDHRQLGPVIAGQEWSGAADLCYGVASCAWFKEARALPLREVVRCKDAGHNGLMRDVGNGKLDAVDLDDFVRNGSSIRLYGSDEDEEQGDPGGDQAARHSCSAATLKSWEDDLGCIVHEKLFAPGFADKMRALYDRVGDADDAAVPWDQDTFEAAAEQERRSYVCTTNAVARKVNNAVTAEIVKFTPESRVGAWRGVTRQADEMLTQDNDNESPFGDRFPAGDDWDTRAGVRTTSPPGLLVLAPGSLVRVAGLHLSNKACRGALAIVTQTRVRADGGGHVDAVEAILLSQYRELEGVAFADRFRRSRIFIPRVKSRVSTRGVVLGGTWERWQLACAVANAGTAHTIQGSTKTHVVLDCLRRWWQGGQLFTGGTRVEKASGLTVLARDGQKSVAVVVNSELSQWVSEAFEFLW